MTQHRLSNSPVIRSNLFFSLSKKGFLMRTRFTWMAAALMVVALAGCGGKDEVKKNEGTIVNTPPASAKAPSRDAPGGTASGGEANKVTAPPTPAIND